MALMHAAARWAGTSDGVALAAATVDHGLRQASAREAQFTAAAAACLGLRHQTLLWTGGKPSSGLQNAAREARYALLSSFARDQGFTAIVTAHTQDDQAETLLMRLARGSGVEGLAGIAPVSQTGGVSLIRPLLGVPKARLKAYLRSLGETWMEDPSNADPRFERIRLRRLAPLLRAAGLDAGAIALSAARMARARDALNRGAAALASASATVHPEGWAEFDTAALAEAPFEIALTLLRQTLAGFGGGARPVRATKLEALCAELRGRSGAWTLGGCRLRRDGAKLIVMREEGRMAVTELHLKPDESKIWDGRFTVRSPEAVIVRPLGEDVRQIEPAAAAPQAVLRTTPAFWRRDQLVAAPLAGRPCEGYDAKFINPFHVFL